ncbi:MAG TPA: archaetidylserine decarboxylase [Steroidobacteraceae bacterium]|nr:archaetidylserine decarboxylase [Steroidobacteraceae bacterium]
MTLRTAIGRLLQQQHLNFALTNQIPRRALTLFMGWFSGLRQPWIRGPSIALWRFFADVDLRDARQTRFDSLHDCFTRELKPGARPVDPAPDVLTSPCDALVGALGRVSNGSVLQAKGQPYELAELLGDQALARRYQGGCYVTLRLTAGMYHRFHAPQDCRVRQVNYFSGDTWNVNPAALQRVARLFCRNERAVIRCQLDAPDQLVTLVPVAAILVASIRLHCLDTRLHLRYQGPAAFHCDVPLSKGEEMGWFEHGSTILLFAPPGFEPQPGLDSGSTLRMGEPLLRWRGD